MSFLLLHNYKMAVASPARQKKGQSQCWGKALLEVAMSESLPTICHNEEQRFSVEFVIFEVILLTVDRLWEQQIEPKIPVLYSGESRIDSQVDL